MGYVLLLFSDEQKYEDLDFGVEEKLPSLPQDDDDDYEDEEQRKGRN